MATTRQSLVMGYQGGDNYFDLTAFNILPVLFLLDELIVRVPEIDTTDFSSGSNAYVLSNPSADSFSVEKDFYKFSLEDNDNQQTARMLFYLNESSQLVVNF